MKKRIRLLYVEDNPRDVDLTQQYFKEYAPEFEIEVVDSGQKCLNRLQDRIFDAMLLDNRLPDLDGMDILKEMKSIGIDLPIVVVTGVGDEELVVKALQAGASDYVAKRGNYVETLPKILKRVMDEFHIKRKTTRSRPNKQHKILYFHSAYQDIRQATDFFNDEAPHLQIQTVTSNEIEFLLQDTSVELVVLDLDKRGLASLELLSKIKHLNLNLPIIVTTNAIDEEKAIATLKLGAYDYIIKRRNYLVQLMFTIEHAITRYQLEVLNQKLIEDMAALNKSLEQKVLERTSELQREINEKRVLEQKLLQSQKLETIGTLAGGVAHDFNNILTAILGNVELGIQFLEAKHPAYQNFIDIKKAATKASDLTDRLLIFSRRQKPKKRVLNLNQTIEDLLRFLRRILGEDIELKIKLASNLGSVYADPGQMQQVLLNLFTNARDAMPNGGVLSLETRNLNGIISSDKRHRNNVEIVVSDTGTGMTNEILARIYEPFFTTKEAGKGTGLGLAMIYGIIEEHEGEIQVKSKENLGTSFKLILPAVAKPTHSRQQTQQEEFQFGSGETIMIVEDDDIVRNVTLRILNGLSYKVLTAQDGEEALRIFDAEKNKIDLVILDVVMPHLSGPEVYRKIEAIKPDLPAIFVTGYDIHSKISEFKSHRNKTKSLVIQKPYTKQKLSKAVRQLLDQSKLKQRDSAS